MTEIRCILLRYIMSMWEGIKMKRKGCYDCTEDVVHPNRKYSLCLDCLIDKLIENGVLEIPVWYEQNIYYDEVVE